jgi:PrtD family type I secretion system ABC transporter
VRQQATNASRFNSRHCSAGKAYEDAVRLVVKPYFIWAGVFSLAINVLLLAAPLYMLQVFDRVVTSRSHETLLMLTVAALAALAAMAALDAVRGRLLAAAGLALDRRIGPRVLHGILEASRTPNSAPQAGHGAPSLRDVATLRAFLVGPGVIALFDAPWLPFFLGVIFLFHPLMGAIALGGALLMCLLAFLNERLTRRPLERTQAAGRRAGRFIDSGLRNMEVIAGLGMLPAVARRWAGLNDAALGHHAEASAVASGFSAGIKLARQFVQIAMLAAGAYLVVQQEVTAGVMIAATILLGRALLPVETLVAGWRSLVEARASWKRVRHSMDSLKGTSTTEVLPPPQGALEAERVVFGVPGRDAPLLRGVSFRLAPGESLGIVGPSAAGKSTLARVLIGVWRPAGGAVRLDGADVATWPRDRLGPHIGYLPQDVELLGGTVADNIARYSEPDPAEVIRAAERAGVHELVLRLPKGYETEVGEGGAALSAGQRQRIALARALYGNPRLVVLDEPNASLDHEGERALLGALESLRKDGVTVVIIAHRPSLMRGIDKLLVLREGAVEAFGPCADIMRRVTRTGLAVREVA